MKVIFLKIFFFKNERFVLSWLSNLIKKLIKVITESLKIINNTGNCLHSSIKQPTSAGPRPDDELFTNHKCLQLNFGLTQLYTPSNDIAANNVETDYG